MNIKGKVAWVTGGSSGIGAATAKALYAEGAKLLITARDIEKGNRFVEQFGDDAMFLKADVAEPRELETAAAKAVEKWGHLDLLFNSAGASFFSAMLTPGEEETEQNNAALEQGMKVLIGGSYHSARVALNYMIKNEPDETGERGSIIFVASCAADKIYTFHTPPMVDAMAANLAYGFAYGAGKAAVLGLARDLSIVCAPHAIRVNTIKPGYILTPLTGAKEGDVRGNDLSEAYFPPMQIFPKHGGRPENIATMAVEIYKNSFVNRAEIAVDAGIVG